jgi:hypothetical protein
LCPPAPQDVPRVGWYGVRSNPLSGRAVAERQDLGGRGGAALDGLAGVAVLDRAVGVARCPAEDSAGAGVRFYYLKWLTHIHAVREPLHGYWQTSDYGYWDSLDGQPVRRALGEMKLKSEIARPGMYEVLEPNRICTISGAAWAGQTVVTEIAVSTDGGETWAEAEFVDSVQRHAWRRWKFDWMVPNAPGRYTLLARARDANGAVQPDQHDERYGSYVINHPLPIQVFVDHAANTSVQADEGHRTNGDERDAQVARSVHIWSPGWRNVAGRQNVHVVLLDARDSFDATAEATRSTSTPRPSRRVLPRPCSRQWVQPRRPRPQSRTIALYQLASYRLALVHHQRRRSRNQMVNVAAGARPARKVCRA